MLQNIDTREELRQQLDDLKELEGEAEDEDSDE